MYLSMMDDYNCYDQPKTNSKKMGMSDAYRAKDKNSAKNFDKNDKRHIW